MNERMLKRALLSNAAFSTLSGFLFLFYGSAVANLVGSGVPLLYQTIGVGLLGFAGYTAWAATRSEINAFDAALISLGDFSWVIGTALVILFAYDSLNSMGILAMTIIAAIVLDFGIFQLIGISRKYAVAGKASTQRLCVVVDTPADADQLWEVIADLGSIQSYSPPIVESLLRDNAAPGINAVRRCTDNKGNTWAEECTRYDHKARALAVNFLADEPGFPYPFGTMTGGWEVEPKGAGSAVTIWFEVTPKYRLFHPLIIAIMSRDLAANFAKIVANMSASAQGKPLEPEAPSMTGISYRLAPC